MKYQFLLKYNSEIVTKFWFYHSEQDHSSNKIAEYLTLILRICRRINVSLLEIV